MSICSRRRIIWKVSPRSNPIWRRFDMNRADDILVTLASRQTSGDSFVLATVVRTVAATAAKAGAKAVILPDGTISQGWIGGGCARGAGVKAAQGAAAGGNTRAGGGAQGGAGRARRRQIAAGVRGAGRRAGRPGPQSRRGSGRRALCQEH